MPFARRWRLSVVKLELNIAAEKLKQGMVRMAQNYLESVSARIKGMTK